jgi:hypothetical protein
MLETYTFVALTHTDERSSTDLQFKIAHSPVEEAMANRDAVERVLGVCDTLLALDSFSVENALTTGVGEQAQRWRVRRTGTLMEWARREVIRIFGGAVCSVVDGQPLSRSSQESNGLVCVVGRMYERHIRESEAELQLCCVIPAPMGYEEFAYYTSQCTWQGDSLQWSAGHMPAQLVLQGYARGYSPGRQASLTEDFVGKVAALHFRC